MRILSGIILCSLFLVGCLFLWNGEPQSGRYIITFDWEDDLIQIVRKAKVLEGIGKVTSLDLINGIAIEVPRSVLSKLKDEFRIRYIEVDPVVCALDSSSLPTILEWSIESFEILDESTIPWYMRVTKAFEAQTSNRAQGIVIGVIDTGIMPNHRDLAGAVVGGYNAITGGSWKDDNGHGTAIAGIIAARENGWGIRGVTECDLYALKCLDKNGRGYISHVIRAYQEGLNIDLPLVNLSLGSWSESQAMKDAMWIAGFQGMGTIAAAGNDGMNNFLNPARSHPAIAVSAVDHNLRRASFSNYAPEVIIPWKHISAPGVEIRTLALDGGHRTVSGTSIATPFITGGVALTVGIRWPWRKFMFETASLANNPSQYLGYGIPDFRAMLDLLIANSD